MAELKISSLEEFAEEVKAEIEKRYDVPVMLQERILELYCHQGDLTKDAQSARRFGELSGKYRGMAIYFLDYLVDNYTEEKIHKLYQH